MTFDLYKIPPRLFSPEHSEGPRHGVSTPPLVQPVVIYGIAGALTTVNWTSASFGAPTAESARAVTAHSSIHERTNGGLTDDVTNDKHHDFASAIAELRHRSGITWDQLAQLFGVDRRSIHFWASGRPLSAPNAARLGRILAVIRRADRGDPVATRTWLLTPTVDGRIPFDLLQQGQYDQVLSFLGEPVSTTPRSPRLSEEAVRSRAPQPPESWVDALQDRPHIERGTLLKSGPLSTKRVK